MRTPSWKEKVALQTMISHGFFVGAESQNLPKALRHRGAEVTIDDLPEKAKMMKAMDDFFNQFMIVELPDNGEDRLFK